MTRRFRPTDAFVDESIRGQRYLLACVLVETKDLSEVRAAVRSLAAERARLHFNKELDATRRSALALFATLPVRAEIVECVRAHGMTEFLARDACLTTLVRRLQARGVSRMTIESRQDDRDDQRVISKVRRVDSPLAFDHRMGSEEPLLWIADAIAWAYGAGGRWATLAAPTLLEVIEARP